MKSPGLSPACLPCLVCPQQTRNIGICLPQIVFDGKLVGLLHSDVSFEECLPPDPEPRILSGAPFLHSLSFNTNTTPPATRITLQHHSVGNTAHLDLSQLRIIWLFYSLRAVDIGRSLTKSIDQVPRHGCLPPDHIKIELFCSHKE